MGITFYVLPFMLQLNPNLNRNNLRLPFNLLFCQVGFTVQLTHKQNQNQ